MLFRSTATTEIYTGPYTLSLHDARPIYVGAKHAVEGITKSVALELAKSGIRVNAVGPGPTDTGMLTRFTGTSENKAALAKQVPLDRLGLSEEVADGILFLGSDGAKWITGEILNVDGGMTAN